MVQFLKIGKGRQRLMTADLETGGFNDTDTLLRERMIPALGAEAAEKFFAALNHLSLTKRAKAIARQAKVLELLASDENPTADIIDFQQAKVTHDELVLAEIPEKSAEYNSEASTGEPLESFSETAIQIEEANGGDSIQDEELKISAKASAYVDSITGVASSALLELRPSDETAFVDAMLAMNQPLDKRMNPKVYAAIIGGVYKGFSDKEIAKMLNDHDDPEVRMKMSAEAVWQRKNKVKSRAQQLARQNGTDLDATLRLYIEKGRRVNEDVSLVTDEVAEFASESEGGDNSDMQQLEVSVTDVRDSEGKEAQPQVLEQDEDGSLVSIYDKLAQLADKEEIDSVSALLGEDRYDEERMFKGREWLGELMSRYVPDTVAARTVIGEGRFDKDAYRVLVKVSGMNRIGRGELPVTLPMHLKYNRGVSEAIVFEYLGILFEQAKNDPQYAISSARLSVVPAKVQEPVVGISQRIQEKQELAEPPLPNLWGAVVDNKPLPSRDVERTINHFLDEAVRQGQLKRTEVVFLTDRLLGGDGRGLLEPEEQAALQKLADMQHQIKERGSSRLDESPAAQALFKDFTTISKAFGATSVATITDRVNRNNSRGNKVNIRQSTVVRQIAAAIQVVLEESRKL